MTEQKLKDTILYEIELLEDKLSLIKRRVSAGGKTNLISIDTSLLARRLGQLEGWKAEND